MILSGSKAIKHWFPHFKREPKDNDYIVQTKPVVREKGMDYLVNPVFNDYPYSILQPNDLYTLKISHIFWDIKWDKHMFDIQFLRKEGCILDMNLFEKLYVYWNQYHDKNKRSELDVTAEEFFNNALNTYDHDYLHTLINPCPVYKKVLKDGAEVDVDEDKFNNLSFNDKMALVREEIYIMAYERQGKREWRQAYTLMLRRFIRNHAPMFEALFIIENYIELHKPIFNYKKHLDHELSRNH